MATTERDYYELLGVARDASPDDIKRAFRKLARELHPDVSDAPDAEHRFREVVEAYEVLSNSERRDLYDRFGHAGLRSGGFQPSSFDFGSLSDLFSAFFGDDLFGVRPPWRRGPRCRHRGARRDRAGRSGHRREAGGAVRRRGAVLTLRRWRRGAGHSRASLPDVQRRRPAAAGFAQRVR